MSYGSTKQTSFKTVAAKIIAGAGRPLHYREITRIATKQGLLKSEGKTPWATMSAQLSMDIINKGESSLFYREQPGFFGIRSHAVANVDAIKLKIKIPKVKAIYSNLPHLDPSRASAQGCSLFLSQG